MIARPRFAVGARPKTMRLRLAYILALAITLRLVALALPTVVHPDEVFQYLEPAHRLLFGTGVTTWEWREGVRGWLLPLVIAVPMAAGAAIAPSSGLYLLLPKLAMLLASLAIVVVGWRLGERVSPLHATMTAAVAAGWYETIYFGPHVTSETIAVALILPAALLIQSQRVASMARLASAGVLLGLAVSIRFQYAPAVAALAGASLWRRPADLVPVAFGGLCGLIPEAVADVAMGTVPYRWFIENVRSNLVAGRAASYGTSGPFGLVALVWPRWSLWGVPLLGLAAIGARRYPALAAMALANFAFHSAIAHKEYRFVLLSAVIAVLLAAIGTADIVRSTARTHGAKAARQRLAMLALGWVAASTSLAFGAFQDKWRGNGAEIAAFATLRNDPALCGVGIYRHHFSRTAGYATLHRDVPMLLFADEPGERPRADVLAAAPAFNRVLAAEGRLGELPPGYTRMRCERGVCVFERPGGCDARAGRRLAIDTALARIDD